MYGLRERRLARIKMRAIDRLIRGPVAGTATAGTQNRPPDSRGKTTTIYMSHVASYSATQGDLLGYGLDDYGSTTEYS